MKYATGGKVEPDDDGEFRPAGVLHRAEGVMPHVRGCVIHWRDTGDGIEYEHLKMLANDCDHDTDDD